MGVSVMQTKNEVQLEQSACTKALLSRFGMDKENSVATPVDINADLVTTSDEVEECDKDLYQSAVGSLLTLPISDENRKNATQGNDNSLCAMSGASRIGTMFWTALFTIALHPDFLLDARLMNTERTSPSLPVDVAEMPPMGQRFRLVLRS
ncbi:hypothetical protein FHG87_019597 [Trinorchestia longiramus]|nr:hypothetical protein FHG87_019597 [Trinorchestia longiramus]